MSIQGVIEEALLRLLKTPVRLIGAGRTDAGVHAQGQVAHFVTEIPLDTGQILHALNGMLTHEIQIKELEPTYETFHAQYAALSKEYHYHLWLEKTIDPFVRLYRHHFCDRRFSLELLREAAAHFVGTHDFTTFSNVGGNIKNNERRLTRLDIVPQEGGIRLEFEGNGFLYKMVRTIVGTLLEVAIGKRAASQIPELFDSRDRRVAGAAAPARGLFLVKINYASFARPSLNSAANEGKWRNSLPNSTDSCSISLLSK